MVGPSILNAMIVDILESKIKNNPETISFHKSQSLSPIKTSRPLPLKFLVPFYPQHPAQDNGNSQWNSYSPEDPKLIGYDPRLWFAVACWREVEESRAEHGLFLVSTYIMDGE